MTTHVALCLALRHWRYFQSDNGRVMDTQHVASLKAIAGSRVPVAVGVHRGEVVVATPGALSENDVCVRWLCSVRERVSLLARMEFAVLVS